MHIPLLLALMSLWGSSACAATVEVTLTSGEIQIGDLLKEDDNSVTISVSTRTKSGKTITATITHQRSKIAKLREVQSLADQYAERVKASGESADANGRLAIWCLTNDLQEEAITQARRAWTLHPGQDDAERVLTKTGHIKVDGKWILETEYLASQGKVKYRNEVLSKEEAAKRKDVDNAKTLLSSARELVQDLEGRERKATKGIEEEAGRKSANEAEAKKFNLFLTDNRPRVGKIEDRIRSAKALYDQTVAFRISEENIYGVGRANPGSYQSERAALDALNAEKTVLQTLNNDLANATTKRDSALRTVADAQEKISAYQKTIDRARTDLIVARANVADLERKAGTAADPVAVGKATIASDVPDIAGLRAAVVLIARFDARDNLLTTGSGFFMAADGRLITNRHVSGIDPTNTFNVFWDPAIKRRSERFRLARVSPDPDIDLACLVPTEPGFSYGFLSVGPVPELATPLRAAGFPTPLDLANLRHTGVNDIVITGGTVNSVRRKDQAIQLIQHDCRLASGNSGGPLINAATGQVIGINTFVVNPQDLGASGDTFFFAIPASQISVVSGVKP